MYLIHLYKSLQLKMFKFCNIKCLISFQMKGVSFGSTYWNIIFFSIFIIFYIIFVEFSWATCSSKDVLINLLSSGMITLSSSEYYLAQPFGYHQSFDNTITNTYENPCVISEGKNTFEKCFQMKYLYSETFLSQIERNGDNQDLYYQYYQSI